MICVYLFLHDRVIYLLTDSPWRVDIRSAATMTAGGSGLQMVPVGVRANFEVKTGGIDHGDIRIAITGLHLILARLKML